MVDIERDEENLTKYEKARIISSRALQISQGSPLLKEFDEEELEELKYDPVKIAKEEFKEGLIPIGIKRELPAE